VTPLIVVVEYLYGAIETSHYAPRVSLKQQETRMLSQALNRAMPHSRNQLKGVNRKEVNILFSCLLLYWCTLKQ